MKKYSKNGNTANPSMECGGAKRNWKVLLAAVVLILVIAAAVVVAVVLLTRDDDDSSQKKKFTFEDFITNKYAPRSFSHTWITGENGFYYQSNDGSVLRFNCTTNSSTILIDNSTFNELNVSSYTISPGEVYALLPYDRRAIYRHSAVSKYKLYNLKSKDLSDVTGENGSDEFQYISWSPTVDGFVFVQENDIYYRNSLQNKGAFRVTNTGKPDEIFNGIPDWVYEEEVLQQDHAIWWAPDGQSFLFCSFNDSEIGLFDLTYYGHLTNQYVEDKRLLYPKAGTKNPTFSLHVFNTKTNTTSNIQPPASLKDMDHYFTTVTWRDNNHVLITWLNRAQNMSIFTMCSAVDGSCFENLRLNSPSGWLDLYDSPTFTPDGNFYFLVLPQKVGNAGTYRHIAMINASDVTNIASGYFGKTNFVTSGLFDVISITKYDSSNRELFYIAYRTGDPTSRHLFRTTTEQGSIFQKPVCVTCSVSDDCDWVWADFPDKGRNFMLQCLGPGVPTYSLRFLDDDKVINFEDNQDIAEELSKLSLPRHKFIQIPLDEQQSMNARLMLPETLKEDDDTKYSMLTDVYGGPDTQKVTKAFSLGWVDYLVSSHNVVIANVDPRGTAGRGDAWRHANYRHLGTTEVDDTIVATKFLKRLKYIGPNSAIWGWSYGGYLTALAIGRGSDAYTCGISVAPVTDWRYYDSIYTERYMGLPTAEDNRDGYDHCNVSSFADNFKKSKFMLVHGTGDDNVHFQNSIQLVHALTEANVYFRSQFYTDQQHSINGGNSRRHLWNTLEDFLMQCFDGVRTHIDELNSLPASP